MDNGKFVISLDFELFWGLAGWEKDQLRAYQPRIEGAIEALERILEVFTKYDMRCTIAFVGGINKSSREDYLASSPTIKPSYSNSLFSSYDLLLSMEKEGEISDKLLFRPDVVEQLQENPLVELGSHTYSHYYALEEGQTIDEFKADIEQAQIEARKKGLVLKTIIFPRNQIPQSYHEVCANSGFTHIRGNEESFLYRSEATPSKFDIKRILRLLDCYFNLTGHHSYKFPRKGVLIDVTASRFLRPYSHSIRFLETLKVRRVIQDIEYAAKHGRIYHLWWHPHNFGIYTDESIMQLEKICKCFAKMRNKYNMESCFICDIK